MPDDRAERRVDEIEDVRPDVEQRAVLDPPARAGERTAEERAGEEARASARSASNVGRVAEELAHLRRVAVGEHHHRADARVADGRRRSARRRRRPARAASRASAALPARAARTASSGCTLGGTAIATASHASRSASNVANAGTPCSAASDCAELVGARPHAGEPRLRSRGEHRRVHAPRPRPRPRQPDPQRLTHDAAPFRRLCRTRRSATDSGTNAGGGWGSWEGERGAGGAGAGVAGGDADRRARRARGRPTRPWPGRRSGRSHRRTSRASAGPARGLRAGRAPGAGRRARATRRPGARSPPRPVAPPCARVAFWLTFVASQPVFSHDEPHPPHAVADRVGGERPHLEVRRRELVRDGPLAVRRDLRGHERRRRVRPGAEEVPAADLDPAELGVVERVPVDEALAVEHVVVPAQQA